MLTSIEDTLEKILISIGDDADFCEDRLEEYLELEDRTDADTHRLHELIRNKVCEINKQLDTIREEVNYFETDFAEIPAVNGHGLLQYRTDSIAMDIFMSELKEVLKTVSPSELISILNILR